jgi:hypothetical protein
VAAAGAEPDHFEKIVAVRDEAVKAISLALLEMNEVIVAGFPDALRVGGHRVERDVTGHGWRIGFRVDGHVPEGFHVGKGADAGPVGERPQLDEGGASEGTTQLRAERLRAECRILGK